MKIKKNKRNNSFSRENLLNDTFNKLLLKPNHRELIRAFIVASNGQIEFEASKFDLVQILFDGEPAKIETLKERVRQWLDSFFSWQEKHGVQLIEIVQKGCRTPAADGRFEYTKTRYKFHLLNELVTFLHSNGNYKFNENAFLHRFKTEKRMCRPPQSTIRATSCGRISAQSLQSLNEFLSEQSCLVTTL